MADGTVLNLGVGGDTIASDDIAGVKHQRVKVQHGADGSATDTSAAAPLPVGFPIDLVGGLDVSTANLAIGATYTSPTFDTATVGPYICHAITANVAGTHIYEGSHNGTAWIEIDNDAVLAGVAFIEDHVAPLRYHRARYVNGAVAQTSFVHSTICRHAGVGHEIGLREGDNVVMGNHTEGTAPLAGEALDADTAIAAAAARSHSEGALVKPRVTLAGDLVMTLDGEVVPVTGAFYQATQPVSGVFYQATQPVSGTFWQATQAVSGTFWQGTQPVSGTVTASNAAGDIGHDGVDSGNPVAIGGIARTALTTVAALDRVKAIFDLQSRLITRENVPRGLRTKAAITLTTTTETTILAAMAATFHDLTKIIVANTSATAVRVDFRDTTAGTVVFSIYAPAGQTVGFTDSTDPIEQAAVNTNWTAQASAAVTDLRIFAQAVRNI